MRGPSILPSAGFAWADGSQKIEAEDARAVPVIEIDLQGVVPDRMSGAGGDLRLEHRQQRGIHLRPRLVGRVCLLLALIIAHRAGTLFAQIREVVVAGVAIGPRDVDARARRHVHLHTGGFSPFIDGNGHDYYLSRSPVCDSPHGRAAAGPAIAAGMFFIRCGEAR